MDIDITQEVTAMLVSLDKNIGGIVASDEELDVCKYIVCDGRTIHRRDYPALFTTLNIKCDTTTLPDYRLVLPGKVNFYMIAK